MVVPPEMLSGMEMLEGVLGAVFVVMEPSSETKREEEGSKPGAPVGVVGAPVVAAAIGEHAPHAAGVVGVRGAELPAGGAAVQLRHPLLHGSAVVAGNEVAQLCSIYREIGVDARGETHFITG